MKILIAQHNPESSEAFCNLLADRMEYIKCKVATTLQEALSESDAHFRADITLLDLILPDASPQEVISSIHKFYPPVIIVSDIDDPASELMFSSFRHGAQNFLSRSALGAKMDSLEAKIEANKLITAITNAHLRNPETWNGR